MEEKAWVKEAAERVQGTLQGVRRAFECKMMNSFCKYLVSGACRASRWRFAWGLWICTFETWWRELWVHWLSCLWNWQWTGWSGGVTDTDGRWDGALEEQPWWFARGEGLRQAGKGEFRAVQGGQEVQCYHRWGENVVGREQQSKPSLSFVLSHPFSRWWTVKPWPVSAQTSEIVFDDVCP